VSGRAAVFGCQIADGDVAKSGRGFFGRRGVAELFGEPGGTEGIHVEVENLTDAIGLNVFVKDIFDNSTATEASFEADDFAAAVVSAAVGDSDIANPPGGFAAEADEAGGVADVTVADGDVFRWAIDPEAVSIAAGLEAYGVVVTFDVAAGDEDIACGVDINAIRACRFDWLVWRADFEVVDFHAIAIRELKVPKG